MEEQTNTPTSNQSRFNETIEYRGLSWKKTSIVLMVLLIIGFSFQRYIVNNKPEARKFSPPKSIVSVQASSPTITDYPLKITTNGTVSAITRSHLVAQVSGEITQVSPVFANGGSFAKGDVLLDIDSRNYASAVSSALANYSQAQANLEQETAEAAQALKEWQRSGINREPNDLMLRKPQLAAAKAQVASAKAAYEKAQLDFSRTKVTAPFDGRVINKNADLGQFVSTGTTLGEVFSNQGLEVQLPLNQHQYAQLIIANKPAVLLSSTLGGIEHQWEAQVVRSDSVFDTSTRQINVTAKVLNSMSDQGLELKIGQYVSAIIEGRVVQQATVIPNTSIREGSYVYLFDEGILRKHTITVIWQDDANSVVTGISNDEQVVTTSLGGAVNGASAKLIGDDSNQPRTKSADKKRPAAIIQEG